MQRQIAFLCTMLLAWSSAVHASAVSQEAAGRKQSLKEKVAQMPSGSLVEVRLTSGQKIRGRLGAINDSGFELQRTQNDKVVTETVAFDNVKSLKKAWGPGKTALVAVVSVFVLIVSVVSIARGLGGGS